MPLLPGKKNIGHNVSEMEKSGHPHKQAVAAALHTALDDDGEEGTINSKLMKQAQHKGVIMSHDAPEVRATTAMNHEDINKKNEQYWGNMGLGIAEPEAPMKAGRSTGPVKVYNPSGTGDEVTPTQSNPPDTRSDNLLERPGGTDGYGRGVAARLNLHAISHGGSVVEHHPEGTGTPKGSYETSAILAGKRKPILPKKTVTSIKHMNDESDGVVSAARAGHAVGTALAEGKVVDEEDSSPLERVNRKQANPAKIPQSVESHERKEIAGEIAKARNIHPSKGRSMHKEENREFHRQGYGKDDLVEGSEAMPVDDAEAAGAHVGPHFEHRVEKKGGSIGEGGPKVISSHTEKTEAKAKTARLNKGLTPGEKKHYGLGYRTNSK